MSQEVVLITGASSGIGWELAKLFAADGSKLILVARNSEKLRQLADELKQSHGTESTVIPMDLAVRDAPHKLYARLSEEGQQVDVLVNNAGFGQFGRFVEHSLDRYTSMCELNTVTLMQMSRLFLPEMLARNQGAILNIGSTASFQPGPNSAVYYATKAFVLSLSEAIQAELWGTGVSVTCLCPGPTRTGFGADSEMGDLPIFKYNSMDVQQVARSGYIGMRKRKRLVVPGVINNLLAFSNRFTARPIVLWFVKQMQPIKNQD